MTKIKLTESQYIRLIQNQKQIIKENTNSNKLNLSNDVIMLCAKLMGVKLTGKNDFTASRAKDNKSVLEDVRECLLNADKRDILFSDLEHKGLKNAKNRFIHNIENIVSEFNKIYPEKQINLNELINDVLKEN